MRTQPKTIDTTTPHYKLRSIIFSEMRHMLESSRYCIDAEASAARLIQLAGTIWFREHTT